MAFVPPPMRPFKALIAPPALPKGRDNVDVPTDEHRFPKIKAAFKALVASGGFDKLREDVDAYIDTVESHSSPSIKRKRQAAIAKWQLMCAAITDAENQRLVGDHEFWHYEPIKRYSKYYLPAILRTAKPRDKGRKYIKAPTLEAALMHFVWAVAKMAIDPVTNEKCGHRLLATDGLMVALEDQLHHIITTEGLDRYLDDKQVYGLLELKLMLEESLVMSGKNGRAVAIQRNVLMGHSLMTTTRPGTNAPSEKEYKEHGKYPKLRDLVIMHNAPLEFTVDMTGKNWKNFNVSVQGQKLTYHYEPVKRWTNVLFDVAMRWVLMLFSRGAFEGITTFDDLYDWEPAHLPIKKEMLDEPLFLVSYDDVVKSLE